MECNTVLSVASCGTYYKDATILQYIDIIAIFATAIQYNTIRLIKISIYCLLQYIATFIAFKVVSVRLLHY